MTTEYRVYELKPDTAAAAATPPRPGKIVRVALAAPAPRTPTEPSPADVPDRTGHD